MFVFYLVGNSFADLFNPQRCKMAKHNCTFQNYKKNNPKKPWNALKHAFLSLSETHRCSSPTSLMGICLLTCESFTEMDP